MVGNSVLFHSATFFVFSTSKIEGMPKIHHNLCVRTKKCCAMNTTVKIVFDLKT